MPAPVLTSFAPATLPANAGGSTTITGVNFTGTTGVKINGSTTAFSVTNDTTLVLTTTALYPGLASVAVTNASGTTTDATKLTITTYTIPTRNNIATNVRSFDTSGTTSFTNNTLGQYIAMDADSWQGAYATYLRTKAKIDAVNLFNKRYPAQAIAVPTF